MTTNAVLDDAMKVLREIAAGHDSWPYGDNGGREAPMLGVAEARELIRTAAANERDAHGYKLQLASALLTIVEIEKFASGEHEPMDDDAADAQLKRIQRLCWHHMPAAQSGDAKEG